jgi:hypothetical protein
MNTHEHGCRHWFTIWKMQVYPMGFVRSCIYCQAEEFLAAKETRETQLPILNPCPSVAIRG